MISDQLYFAEEYVIAGKQHMRVSFVVRVTSTVIQIVTAL